MGQANAARDSLYDLRECKMNGKSASTFDLSGALMAKGDFSNVDFKETQLSKVSISVILLDRPCHLSSLILPQVYAPEANFDGADFSNGVIDRAYFKGSSFKGAIFK